MKQVELKDKILNEVLEDVRKYRDYLSYKSKKNSKKISPKFNFWDLRDSIRGEFKPLSEDGYYLPYHKRKSKNESPMKKVKTSAVQWDGLDVHAWGRISSRTRRA